MLHLAGEFLVRISIDLKKSVAFLAFRWRHAIWQAMLLHWHIQRCIHEDNRQDSVKVEGKVHRDEA